MGYHDGLVNYTIGQRKGIGVGGIKGNSSHEPNYVVDIDPINNKIIVGPKNKLRKYIIYIKDLNFCSKILPEHSFKANIKVRSGNNFVNGTVNIKNKIKNTGVIELSRPETGIAPGQACVFYDNFNKMIGGGWISASEKNV